MEYDRGPPKTSNYHPIHAQYVPWRRDLGARAPLYSEAGGQSPPEEKSEVSVVPRCRVLEYPNTELAYLTLNYINLVLD